jgi:HSP20 family protein
MTLVKFNPFAPTHRINNLHNLDKFINDVFSAPLFNDDARHATPSVNVVESADNFKLEVAAPGLTKEDFKLNIEEDVLTISAEKKVETEEKTEKYLRKEFGYSTFKRTFTLPDNINVEAIKASYDNGVLNITIPKVEVKKTTQTIDIQ